MQLASIFLLPCVLLGALTLFPFSLLLKLSPFSYYRTQRASKIPIRWTAVECLDDAKERRFSEKTDVWSFGVLVFEIFEDGARPYKEFGPNFQVIERVQAGYRMKCPASCPVETFDLICKPCWNEDPTERPTFKQLLNRVKRLITGYEETPASAAAAAAAAAGSEYADPSLGYQLRDIPLSALQEGDVDKDILPQLPSQLPIRARPNDYQQGDYVPDMSVGTYINTMGMEGNNKVRETDVDSVRTARAASSASHLTMFDEPDDIAMRAVGKRHNDNNEYNVNDCTNDGIQGNAAAPSSSSSSPSSSSLNFGTRIYQNFSNFDGSQESSSDPNNHLGKLASAVAGSAEYVNDAPALPPKRSNRFYNEPEDEIDDERDGPLPPTPGTRASVSTSNPSTQQRRKPAVLPRERSATSGNDSGRDYAIPKSIDVMEDTDEYDYNNRNHDWKNQNQKEK